MRWVFVSVACAACGGQIALPPPPDAASEPDAATAPDASIDAAPPPTHCTATATTVLAPGQGAYRIAIDDEYVYWLAAGSARRVAKGGGPVDQLGVVSSVATLAVTASSLYAGRGNVVRIPKSGGTAQTVLDNVQAFAVDAAETTLAYVRPSPATLYVRALPSGVDTAIATLPGVQDVAVLAMPGDGYVYYGAEQVVARVPVAGGPIEPLAPAYSVETFAFDATTLFIAEQDGQGASRIYQVPRTGGTPSYMASTTYPREIGVDDTRIFWADDADLWEQPKTTGWPKSIGPTEQAPGPLVAPSLAIDGTCIYWAASDPTGAIYAMPIPPP